MSAGGRFVVERDVARALGLVADDLAIFTLARLRWVARVRKNSTRSLASRVSAHVHFVNPRMADKTLKGDTRAMQACAPADGVSCNKRSTRSLGGFVPL